LPTLCDALQDEIINAADVFANEQYFTPTQISHVEYHFVVSSLLVDGSSDFICVP
jgi:hypothetical protein